jgi:hypothetical protein
VCHMGESLSNSSVRPLDKLPGDNRLAECRVLQRPVRNSESLGQTATRILGCRCGANRMGHSRGPAG